MLLTPIFGFILTIILCVINIYSQLLFIPGNISDVLAYSVFNGDNSFTLGIILQLLWIAILSLFGDIIIRMSIYFIEFREDIYELSRN